jgi:hypothetical protein
MGTIHKMKEPNLAAYQRGGPVRFLPSCFGDLRTQCLNMATSMFFSSECEGTKRYLKRILQKSFFKTVGVDVKKFAQNVFG